MPAPGSPSHPPRARGSHAPVGEALSVGLGRAAVLGLLTGATLGAAESLRWLLSAPPRTANRALRLVELGVIGDALLGGLVALALYLPVRLLARPADHRVARPSAVAGLGAALGLMAWIGPLHGGPVMLALASLTGALCMLALRELLAWWSLLTRPRTWSTLAAVGTLISVGLALTVSAPEPPGPSPEGAPNVLLVSIDTLRADHVGAYGAQDAHTPVLDALASEGILFEDATSQANTTGPSHSTMLTGQLPAEHGAYSNGVPLSGRSRSLPDLLSPLGWESAAFVSGFTLVDELCGLADRFGHYDDDLTAWSWLEPGCERLRWVELAIARAGARGERALRGDRPAQETIDSALEWLRTREGDAPFFAFVHLYDPHAPYEAPTEFTRLHAGGEAREGSYDWYRMGTAERRALVEDEDALAHMLARYKGEISYSDAQVGRLLDELRSNGSLDDTLVIVTSDHGEGLGAHGYHFDHGSFLYEEELAVPLLVRLPGAAHAGLRVPSQVRLLDLAPSLAEWLDLESELGAATSFSGSSLAPLLEPNARAQDPRPSFAVSDISGELSGFALDGRRLSLRVGGRKLILSSEHWLDTERVPARLQAFDLERDPDELDGQAGATGSTLPAPFEALRVELEGFESATRELQGGEELSEGDLARLRELGYL